MEDLLYDSSWNLLNFDVLEIWRSTVAGAGAGAGAWAEATAKNMVRSGAVLRGAAP